MDKEEWDKIRDTLVEGYITEIIPTYSNEVEERCKLKFAGDAGIHFDLTHS